MISRSIQKYKHVVDRDMLAISGTVGLNNSIIVQGSDNPVIANDNIVQAKSAVRAIVIDITFTCAANVAGGGQVFDWYWMFNPQNTLTAPAANAVGTSTAKSYVFKQGVVTVPASPSIAPTKITGLLKIPRKYQRFMNSDAIIFGWNTRINRGATDSVSIKSIYKEIRG